MAIIIGQMTATALRYPALCPCRVMKDVSCLSVLLLLRVCLDCLAQTGLKPDFSTPIRYVPIGRNGAKVKTPFVGLDRCYHAGRHVRDRDRNVGYRRRQSDR